MSNMDYFEQIGGGFKPGFVVKVRGKIGDDTSGFTVKLSSGKKRGDDATFAVVAKQSNVIAMTCQKDGTWIKEKVTKDCHYPFKIHSEFFILIQCLKDKYKLFVNHLFIDDYLEGLPCQLAQYLIVGGAVELQEVQVQAENECAGDSTVAIPVDRDLEWSHDVSVIIEGIPVKADPYRMVIDFATKTSPQDIFLHFNANFKDRQLGRNSRFGTDWDKTGEIHLHSGFPFAYGVPFKLEFTVDEKYVFAYLNDIFLLKYRHRKTPYTEMKKMNIYGSVIITKALVGRTAVLHSFEQPPCLTNAGRVIVERD